MGKIKQKGGINKSGTADEKTNKEIYKKGLPVEVGFEQPLKTVHRFR